MVDEASKIREEILSGRAELAETVQALVEKADVKGRVRDALSENAEHIQQLASEKASQLTGAARTTAKTADRSYLARGAGGLLLLLMMFFLVRRSRNR